LHGAAEHGTAGLDSLSSIQESVIMSDEARRLIPVLLLIAAILAAAWPVTWAFIQVACALARLLLPGMTP
jgi:hypothetical protein